MDSLNGIALPILPYVVCDQHGEVVRFGTAPGDSIPAQAQPGEYAFMGVVAPDQYVDLATSTVMQKQAITPTIAGLELSNLPSPCIVTVETERVEVVGGTIMLAFDVPGEYMVVLDAPRHLQTVVQVTQP